MEWQSLTPKSWTSFQHYKDRSPRWIKLHRSLMDDYVFSCLPSASKALAPFLWLLASEYEDGKITAGVEEVAFRLRMTPHELEVAVTPLIDKGYFVASKVLAERYQVASPEQEQEQEQEQSKSKRQTCACEEIYAAYPRKVAKPEALRAINKALTSKPADELLRLTRLYATSREGQPLRFTPHPATWFNQQRYNDDPATWGCDEQKDKEKSKWERLEAARKALNGRSAS